MSVSEAHISESALREVRNWMGTELPDAHNLDTILDTAREQAHIYFQRREYFLAQAQQSIGNTQDTYFSLAERCKTMHDQYRQLQHMYAIRGFTHEDTPQDSIIYCKTLREARAHLETTDMTVLFIYDFASRTKHTPEEFPCTP